MRKKYYGYFIHNNEEYVIQFEIEGSLQFDKKQRCFIDKDWYVKSIDYVIYMAAFDSCLYNDKHTWWALLLSHKQFKEFRSKGIKRWDPCVPIIYWD